MSSVLITDVIMLYWELLSLFKVCTVRTRENVNKERDIIDKSWVIKSFQKLSGLYLSCFPVEWKQEGVNRKQTNDVEL